jgi:hypothetical protein
MRLRLLLALLIMAALVLALAGALRGLQLQRRRT